MKAKRPPTGERAGDLPTNVSLSGNASIVSSRSTTSNVPGGSGGTLRDLEAAGQRAGERAGDGHRACARVDSEVAAAELPSDEPTGPGDSTAEVEHGDARRDPRPLRERPDLPARMKLSCSTYSPGS